MKMIKNIALAFSLTMVAAPALADTPEEATPVTAIAEAPTPKVITAKVNGLVCDFCAQALNKVFQKTKQIETVDVNLDESLVIITLKPDGELDDEMIAKLIRNSGYAFISLERSA